MIFYFIEVKKVLAFTKLDFMLFLWNMLYWAIAMLLALRLLLVYWTYICLQMSVSMHIKCLQNCNSLFHNNFHYGIWCIGHVLHCLYPSFDQNGSSAQLLWNIVYWIFFALHCDWSYWWGVPGDRTTMGSHAVHRANIITHLHMSWCVCS